MVIRSYVCSTDSHCESRSQNIFSSIDVSVNVCNSAARTIPITDTKRHLFNDKTTVVTSLTAREKSVDFDDFSPVPFTLIFELTEHFPPSSIGDRPSQLVVFDHVPDRKVFNSYQAIVPNQIRRQLMQKIGTSIFNFGVYSGYFKSRFVSVTRAFGFPTQFLLRYFKLLVQPIKMLGIGYFFTVAGTNQTGYTSVNANLFRCWWKSFNSVVIYQQRDEPTSRWFEFNCNCRRTTAIRQKPRPNYWQRFFALGKPEFSVLVFKSRLGKFSRATVTFFLKSRILGSFSPEISKSFFPSVSDIAAKVHS